MIKYDTNIIKGINTNPALLAQLFPLVSHRDKTIPGPGSRTWKTEQIIPGKVIAKRAVYHKNGNVSLFTNKGVLKLWLDNSLSKSAVIGKDIYLANYIN